MNWLLDTIILVILAVGVFLGWKRGFVKTAVIAASGIISLLVALFLSKPVSGILGWMDLPNAVVRILAFVILYFVTKLLLRLVAGILTKLLDVPFLRKLNKGMGIALSTVLALIRILMFCLVMNGLIDAADFLGWGIFDSLEPESTILFKLFSSINIFNFIL